MSKDSIKIDSDDQMNPCRSYLLDSLNSMADDYQLK